MARRSLVESCAGEWSRYFHLPAACDLEVLHARFVAHRFARHAHDYFVVGYIESGVQAFRYRRARHVTGAGQVFFVNAGEMHTGEAARTQGYVYRTMYPRAALLEQVAYDVTGARALPSFDAAVVGDRKLAELLRRFHCALADGAASLLIESSLHDALAHLILSHTSCRRTSARIGRERPGVSRAREYIHSHFAIDVSLHELAKVASLSPFHLARSFEREVGQPPHAYLDRVRIERARALLDAGTSIADAATAVGYADQSHLTRRFKRLLGITPGQFARERRSTEHEAGARRVPSNRAGVAS
jgi:AraC-like DNA-binding protein